MTLVSDIIKDAYRESNLISINAEPTTAEQAEGLTLLARFVASVYGNEAGEELQPIIIGRNNINRPQGYPWYEQVPNQTDWFLPADARMNLNLTSPQTVYLDPNPRDGQRFAFIDQSKNLSTYSLTINANGRTISTGDSLVFSTDGDAQQFFYRADLGDWVKLTPLDLTGVFPFPEEFEDFFSIGLSFRLNPRHATEMDQQSLMAFQRNEKKFKARYRQSKEIRSDPALTRLPSTKGQYYDNTRLANSIFSSGYANPFGTRFPF